MDFKKKVFKTAISTLAVFSILSIPNVEKDINPHFSFVYTAFAKSQDVEALASRIEALPPLEDIKESDGKEVVALMKMYKDLSMAEKIDVPNFDKLDPIFRKLVDDGVITDEEKESLNEEAIAKEQQQNKQASNKEVEAQSQEFVFDITEDGSSTVIVRFTADTNGDGKKDVPDRIILTSPEGKVYPISNTSVTMQDGDKMKTNLTWTNNFLQLDFAKALKGRWSINTSEPVTFSQTPYAGAMQEIKAENGDKDPVEESSDDVAPEEGDSDDGVSRGPKKKKEEGGISVGTIAIMLLLVAGIGFMFFKMRQNSTGAPSNPGNDSKNINKKLEEYNKRIKEPSLDDDISADELKAELSTYKNKLDYIEEDNNYVQEKQTFSNGYSSDNDIEVHTYASQGNVDNNRYDIDDNFEMEEYRESGDTGLLSKDESPFEDQNDDFSDFDDDFTKF